MTVGLAFDTVLARVPCFGEQANDLEEFAFGVFLIPIGRKADRLANHELGCCHRTSQHIVFMSGFAERWKRRTRDQALTVADCLPRGLDKVFHTPPSFSAPRDEIARS